MTVNDIIELLEAAQSITIQQPGGLLFTGTVEDLEDYSWCHKITPLSVISMTIMPDGSGLLLSCDGQREADDAQNSNGEAIDALDTAQRKLSGLDYILDGLLCNDGAGVYGLNADQLAGVGAAISSITDSIAQDLNSVHDSF